MTTPHILPILVVTTSNPSGCVRCTAMNNQTGCLVSRKKLCLSDCNFLSGHGIPKLQVFNTNKASINMAIVCIQNRPKHKVLICFRFKMHRKRPNYATKYVHHTNILIIQILYAHCTRVHLSFTRSMAKIHLHQTTDLIPSGSNMLVLCRMCVLSRVAPK